MGEDTAAAKYTSEFIGTFVLVFTVGCNVLTGQPVWGGISIACSLTVMIYALAKSSGANFNPAVSLALGLSGALAWKEVAVYMVMQLLGGALAGLAFMGLLGSGVELAPVKGHTWWQAGLAELLYTCMLCFVVLNVAASKKHAGKSQFYGLAIGFVIVAGAYSGGNVSMGCFNPAVAFGLDISQVASGEGQPGWYSAVYLGFELVGAALAAALFRGVRPGDFAPPSAEERLSMLVAHEVPEPPLGSKLGSEFLGTYMLVLTVGLNVLTGSAAAVFSIAASLMCMIFALGSVSGAHFNPAVTAAIMCSGRDKCPPKDGMLYILVQLVGGIAAAFTYKLLMNGKTFALKPEDSSWQQALIGEFVFTFVLSFVVLSVATVKEDSVLSEYFGFAIGMCVTAGGLAIGKLSGGSLNPGVSVGLSVAHLEDAWACLPYALVEVAAGAAAAGIFRVTQPSEYSTPPPTGATLLSTQPQEKATA